MAAQSSAIGTMVEADMRRIAIVVLCLAGLAAPAAAQQAIPSEELMTAVREGDSNKLIGALEKGGNLANIRGFDGWTPLTLAVSKRNMGFASYLIDKGADPNLATRDGQTPLILATQLR